MTAPNTPAEQPTSTTGQINTDPAQTFEGISKGVRIGIDGYIHLTKHAGMPFQVELTAALEQLGFVEGTDAFDLPGTLQLVHRAPELRMSGDVSGYLLAIGLFMGTNLSAWAIKKFYDEIYTGAVRPAFTKFGKRFEEKAGSDGSYPQPVMMTLSMYFDVDKIQVSVQARCKSPAELQRAEALLPLAYERALDRIERYGVQGRQYTYQISSGQLSEFPVISSEYLV